MPKHEDAKFWEAFYVDYSDFPSDLDELLYDEDDEDEDWDEDDEDEWGDDDLSDEELEFLHENWSDPYGDY